MESFLSGMRLCYVCILVMRGGGIRGVGIVNWITIYIQALDMEIAYHRIQRLYIDQWHKLNLLGDHIYR
jgi:hypothetical protein